MRSVPVIEVDLVCAAGSPADYGKACGLDTSAVCTGVLLELMLVATREMGISPASLFGVTFSGHAAIGSGLRLSGHGYDRSVEVVSGRLEGEPCWSGTHAFARLDDSAASGARPKCPFPSALTCLRQAASNPIALAYVRGRAADASSGAAFVAEVRGEAATQGLLLQLATGRLVDVEAYALHPLLWEAGVAAAELVLGNAVMHAHPQLARASRARSLRVHELGVPVREVVVLRQTGATGCPQAAIRWLGDAGKVVAEIDGLEIDPSVAFEPVEQRCARIVHRALGKRIPDVHQPLVELGVSSIDRARVASALALEFGAQPNLAAILECESLADLAKIFARAPIQSDAVVPKPPPLDPNARWPLSPAQRQVWVLHEMAPDTPRCHLHVRLRLIGELYESALTLALRRLIERHASLRVVLDRSGDEPLQYVTAARRLALERIELRSTDASSRLAELQRVSDAHARTAFDMEAGPLVRFALVQVAACEHALLITAHHLIVDGFGLEVMLRELLTLYDDPNAFNGETFGLERVMRGRAVAVSTRVDGRSGILPARDAARRIPLARDPDGSAAGHGARAEITHSPALSASLRELAQRERVSLFSLLCAAYAYVLARHAGQSEVVIGVVSAARESFDDLGAVGMFARSLPLRVALDADSSLIVVAREIHTRVHALRDDDGASDATPFAATALFQQWSQASLATASLDVRLELDSPDGAPSGSCRSELELLAADLGAELSLCLQYDRSVVLAQTAQWLAQSIGRALTAVCIDPTRSLRAVALVDPSETFAMHGPSTALDGTCVHHRIAQRAELSPDAIAVRDIAGTTRTYRELVERARAAASALRGRGIAVGCFVAIVAERVADLPTAVLAVLESGGAYVPIDPAHPLDRVMQVLEGAKVELVITWRESAAPATFGIAEASFEGLVAEGRAALGARRAAPLDAGIGPNDAAYLLHTSGSTGKPKGVIVEHQSLASFVHAMDRLLPQVENETWLALTTLAFDISIVELLCALARGGEARIGTAPSLRSAEIEPLSILRTLGHGVTCFQCTPSLARLLLEDVDGRAFLRGLALLLVGGEALPLWLARALCEAVPGAVFNMYGPTETTVWSSAARIDPRSAWVPIGAPLANTALQVVDESGSPVPYGLSGELWIGGAGVARGYLDRADETAARFVTRSGASGDQRWYRTGDLVRVRSLEPAGLRAQEQAELGEAAAAPQRALEWLGRLDRQIKIAGNRIELGEVEGVLIQHPFARECAVLAENIGSIDLLVAFVVPDEASTVDACSPALATLGAETSEVGTVNVSTDEIEAALLGWAAQKLPTYMVPTRVFIVASLPRTGSGKTDHQALAKLSRGAAYMPAAFDEAPTTREERVLAQLWREVLARSEISRFDDFFALGGTSFAAVLLASRARKHGIALAPSTVLAHPMLADQALQVASLARQREARVLQDEAKLGALPRASSVAAFPPKRVVLTGATGFLGAHLLVELLGQTDAEIVCLIRARDDLVAQQRLAQCLVDWGLSTHVQWQRTRCLAADLTLPHFGLSPESWAFLAQHCDLVMHNAAEVNFALAYDELRPTNVGGTLTAIALAAEARRKPLHYVSTIAITGAADAGAVVDEGTALPRSEHLTDGYSQSKWVAERLVALAAEQGLAATSYRAGPLVADRAPKGDAFAEALATIARTGVCFSTEGRAVPHLSRVDDTARAIVTLALAPNRSSRVEHVVSPQRLSVAELLAWIREGGFDVSALSDEAWFARIDGDPWAAATMFVVAQRLREGSPLVPEVVHDDTRARLATLGFVWRDIDGSLIRRLLARLTAGTSTAEAG